VFFFFQKKKQKAFVLLRRMFVDPKEPRRANVFGSFLKKNTPCPKNLTNLSRGVLLFPEKEAKSVCSASQNAC
jgi:hypothetical protein